MLDFHLRKEERTEVSSSMAQQQITVEIQAITKKFGSVLAVDELSLGIRDRSEEHTSELQSLMRISYAVFCLKKKKKYTTQNTKKERLILQIIHITLSNR